MQHEIIMPALGMSQDTGTLLAWHKSEGDAVSSGDILFEVETDKTTMEVEAPADGFVVGISAEAGAEVPVGQVIAFISDKAEAPAVSAEQASSDSTDETAAASDALPAGQTVIMPTLGMAQDSGLLVAWSKAPGDKIDADDVLFEVETDKSIAEVTAGHSGYLVARLAAAGDDVPTGETIAIIAAEPVDQPIDRAYLAGAAVATTPTEESTNTQQEQSTAPASASIPTARPVMELTPAGSRILASPKLKRLAMQENLDLKLLVDAGVAQPYHFSDLQQLRDLHVAAAASPAGAVVAAKVEVSASVDASGFDNFLDWIKANTAITDEAQVLASLLGSSLPSPKRVGVASLGETQVFQTHQQISATTLCDDAEEVHLRDLRNTFIEAATLTGGALPEVTLMRRDGQLKIQLSAPQAALEAAEALCLVNNFAERLADPMRQLL